MADQYKEHDDGLEAVMGSDSEEEMVDGGEGAGEFIGADDVDLEMQAKVDAMMAEMDANDAFEAEEAAAAAAKVAKVEEEVDEDAEKSLEDTSVQGFFDHTAPVYTVSMCPIGSGLVCSGGGDDVAHIWSAYDGQLLHTLKGHTDSVVCSEFSNCGKYVATGGMDDVVKIWNVKTGEMISELDGPGDVISFVHWHPRGPIVLFGSDDSSAWMFNALSGMFLQTFTAHSGEVSCGNFTPDGKNVITCSFDNSMKVWDPRSGSCKKSVENANFHHQPILSMSIHPTKPVVITGGATGRVALVNYETGKILQAYDDHKQAVECVAFSNAGQGQFYATGCIEGRVKVRETGNNLVRCQFAHEESIVKMQWHSSQPLLYTLSADGTAALWDVRTGNQLKKWSGHSDLPLAMAVDRKGELLVTGGDDENCLVFSTLDKIPDRSA